MELEKSNKELLTELNKREDYWNNTIKSLTKRLNCQAKDVVQLQSDTLSQKQRLEDEIKYITYEVLQFKPIIKRYRKTKTEFYLTKYPIKTQGKDKLYLIESDLAIYDQRLEIYDTHIDFLKGSSDILEQIGYGIKNKITLYQLTDLD